jgi:diguanylate cyclase (GGDEF)-like protein/PAS domain S-box-containing protein
VFRLIVENAVDLIVRVDAGGNRTYVSPSSREMLGFDTTEMMGKHAYELVHPDDLQRAQTVATTIGPQHPCQDLMFRMRRSDGHYIWVGATYRHLPDDGVLAILRDITAQKLTEQRLGEAIVKLEAANTILRGLAHVDGLTGLANRRHFDELLDEEFRRAQRQELPLGLVLFDVDHFKAFNDRYGHLGGDDCLRRISRCVGDALRRPGDFAARYGGEEIALLLPATDACGSTDAAERIRDAVAKLHIEHAGSGFGLVTVSAGAAATHPFIPGSDAASLIKAADIALYQAKAAGRNCVRCRPNELVLATVESAF